MLTLACPVLNLGSNVTISGVTILAPVHSPNTDGIDPGRSVTLVAFCSAVPREKHVRVHVFRISKSDIA